MDINLITEQLKKLFPLRNIRIIWESTYNKNSSSKNILPREFILQKNPVCSGVKAQRCALPAYETEAPIVYMQKWKEEKKHKSRI